MKEESPAERFATIIKEETIKALNLVEILERSYNPPALYIFEEVEIGGGYHTLHAVQSWRIIAGLIKEQDWSEPYTKSGVAKYRSRIVKVPYPPIP